MEKNSGEGEATAMDANAQYNPRTVEEVFRDFKGRRAGLIKALTSGTYIIIIIIMIYNIYVFSFVLF